jgi:iron complex outermembrane receptor protein
MAALAAGAAAITPSYAQRAPVTLADEVVVTATRFPENRESFPIGVSTITREQISRSSAATIPELLSQHAGIHVRDTTGGPDLQVDMRGFGITGDQNTLVLVDGQRISEIELVSTSWSSIPLGAIERIEIMRGSGAVLYGGGATGGTINIITRKAAPGERSAAVSAAAGSYSTTEIRAGGSIAGERAGLALSGTDYYSDNYRVNNRLRQRNADADVRYGDSSRNVGISFAADEQDLRNPGVRSAAQLDTDRRGATTPFDFSTRRGARINARTHIDVGPGEFAANLGYRDRHATGTQLFFGATTMLDTEVKVWSFSPRFRMPFTLAGISNSLVVGTDFDDWDYGSTFSGGFFASHALARQSNSAAYLQNNAQFGDTSLTFGARTQRTRNTVSELLPAPSTVEQTRSPRAYEVALRQRLSPRLSLFGKIGRSFRIATVDENRFQVTPLEPQTSHDRELGAEWRGAATRMRASLFQLKLDNEIYFSPIFPPFGANINLSPTEREGLELESAWSISSTLDLFANYAYTSAKFRSGVYGGIDVSGRDVPLVPKNVLTLGGSWRIADRTQLSAVVRYVANQRFDNDQANTFGQKIPDYAPLDIKLTHQTGPWLLGLAVRNVFDQKYFSYGIANAAGTSFNAYPAAERNFLVSAEYKLK